MKDLYVIFDGGPGAEAGRFVEVENAYRESANCGPATWEQRDDGLWSLGAFRSVEATDGVTESKTVLIRGDARRITVDLVNDAIGDIARGAPRLATNYFGLKDYDRFRGQRADGPYMTGPRHGSTVVAVELQSSLRASLAAGVALTDEEQADATEFLTRFPIK